jgi:hypothetical protein
MARDISALYSDGVFERFGYLATWFPGAAVRLGDRGQLSGRLWSRDGSVPRPLLASGTRKGDRVDSFEWVSGKEISVEAKAAGELVADLAGVEQASAGIAIAFAKRGGTVFRATGLVIQEVEDTAPIRKWMMDEGVAGRLPPETLVVTRVVRASSCAVFVGGQADARVEMRLGVPVDVGVPLASLDAGAVVARSSGMAACLSMVGGSTPLFGGLLLRDGPWRGLRVEDVLFGDRGLGDGPEPIGEPIEEVGLP